jgi:putative transposase
MPYVLRFEWFLDTLRADGFLVSLVVSFGSWLRSRAALQVELLALRHQLQLLNQARPRRLRLATADRWLWAWLSRSLPSWRTALVIVKPETVIAWHRRGFRMFWRWKSRRRIGRPTMSADVRTLIRTMSEANPLWGAPRIHGELVKLGIDVAQASVAKSIAGPRHPPPSQDLADIPPESHRPDRGGGLLRRADCDVSPAVRPGDSGP